jgi:hypothetical protein
VDFRPEKKAEFQSFCFLGMAVLTGCAGFQERFCLDLLWSAQKFRPVQIPGHSCIHPANPEIL